MFIHITPISYRGRGENLHYLFQGCAYKCSKTNVIEDALYHYAQQIVWKRSKTYVAASAFKVPVIPQCQSQRLLTLAWKEAMTIIGTATTRHPQSHDGSGGSLCLCDNSIARCTSGGDVLYGESAWSNYTYADILNVLGR